jgi:hypothetical protein
MAGLQGIAVAWHHREGWRHDRSPLSVGGKLVEVRSSHPLPYWRFATRSDRSEVAIKRAIN